MKIPSTINPAARRLLTRLLLIAELRLHFYRGCIINEHYSVEQVDYLPLPLLGERHFCSDFIKIFEIYLGCPSLEQIGHLHLPLLGDRHLCPDFLKVFKIYFCLPSLGQIGHLHLPLLGDRHFCSDFIKVIEIYLSQSDPLAFIDLRQDRSPWINNHRMTPGFPFLVVPASCAAAMT